MKILALLAAASLAAPSLHAQPAAQADSSALNWWLLDPATDNVPGIAAQRAYRELLAGRQPRDTVVVAIIDSGVEVDHPDLDDNLWRNPREVAGNGRDDDNNGYVDDIHGWNFIGGRDGRNVHHDTYEVTRLYARLRPRFERANPDTLSGAAREDYELWQRVRRDFTARRDEERGYLQQMRMAAGVLTQVTTALKQELKVDSLTVEAVSGLRPNTEELRRAKEFYLLLAGQGLTPARLQEEIESMQGRVDQSLNPEFDPRPIVGDNPANPRERSYGNNDYEGPDAMHGTHVAGIVGAEHGNRLGIEGVAPVVRLMILRTVPDGDERDKDVANAIRYAADNGADIINMSFGKSFSPEKPLVDAAVRHADSLGVLMIHAAGNDGADLAEEPSFPTRSYLGGGQPQLWLEVGASTWMGGEQLAAPFSNYGRTHVDVFAPGMAIYSSVTDADYQRNDGTSMAAPVVSGVAALLMAYFPDLTPQQVRQIIIDSATRYPDLRVVRPGSEGERVPFAALSASGGVVNLYRAVQMAQQMSRSR